MTGPTSNGPPRRLGVYPGSFNPPTVAHLAIAHAAQEQRRLARVDLVVSRVSLAKEEVDRPLLRHRLEVIRASIANLPWCELVVTNLQLLADIAGSYDVLILGADKWSQVLDARFYGSPEARDLAVACLPELAIAPRPPHDLPAVGGLDLPDHVAAISSTAARSGAAEAMTPAAAAFDARTGAWTDPDRYAGWLETQDC